MKNLYILLIVSLASITIKASHLKGGKISIEYNSNFNYNAKIELFKKASSGISVDSITVDWGDGERSTILSNNSENISSDIEKLVFISSHTYNQDGKYDISVSEPNRESDIINIPNSSNQNFYIQTSINVNSNVNYSSVHFFADPIFTTTTNNIFKQNLGAYNINTNGLILFELINTKGSNGGDISGYQLPDSCFIDSTSGELLWNTPSIPGTYVLTVKVSNFVNDSLISSSIVDISVDVYDLSKSSETKGIESWPQNSNGDYFYLFDLDTTDSLHLSANYIDSTADTISVALYSEIINSNGIYEFKSDNSTLDSTSFSITLRKANLESRCNPYIIVFRLTSIYGNLKISEDITISLLVSDSSISNCPILNTNAPNSIHQASKQNRIEVFPNPTNAFVYFSGRFEDSKLYLYNSNGQLLSEKDLGQTNSTKLNLRELEGDIFLYTILNNKKLLKKGKIIKN